MDVGVRNSKQLTVTSPRVIDFIASPRSCRSDCGGHGAEPARLGDTPDSHRVDPFSVDDVDGGGDRLTIRDLASFAARRLLDSRYAYSVAYLVRDRKQISTTKRKIAMTNTAEQNKALVLEAFETLFNRRDYAAAQRFWSPDYVQHSAAFGPGRAGLFDVIKGFPADLRYENALIIADGDYVVAHGRFSSAGLAANMIAADIVRMQGGVLVEHWDVIQDEATAEESKSGLPMFGDSFPTRA
jgi:predicted SnoaL-like aldol condensation-catalyzing enzyme